MNTSICIVSVGGGAAKIVDRLTSDNENSPFTVTINTDKSVLEESRAMSKLQIGENHTGGLGTGGDVEMGRLSAESDVASIKNLFVKKNLVIMVVALGGGTGTGAAPIILNAARDAGATTLCFATLPFKFEGQQRVSQAENAITPLRDSADALILVPNDKLFEFIGESKVADAFQKAEEFLSASVGAVYKLITDPGFINIDLANLRKVIEKGGGVCNLLYGEGSGKNRGKDAINSLLKSSLSENGEVVARAKSMLVSIVGGADLALNDIGSIMDAVSSKAPKDCSVSMGTVVDDTWQDKVVVVIIVSDQWVVAQPESEHHQPEPSNLSFTVQAEKTEDRPVTGKKRKSKEMQAKLSLEPSGKGRFKNVEPTMLDGEDLDIPTFIRKGIVLDK